MAGEGINGRHGPDPDDIDAVDAQVEETRGGCAADERLARPWRHQVGEERLEGDAHASRARQSSTSPSRPGGGSRNATASEAICT